MGKIAILGEDLINKIAAGEVVERPASVLKELCENSLDAGARTLRIALKGGGLEEIAVTDDGCGMSPEDARLSVCRHATSKLREASGLFAIATLGFRGEALPAIASVSRFSMVTAEPGAAVGTRVEQQGSGSASVTDAPPRPGTRVRTQDLFFNTPARRKFLKRAQTELKHCSDAVTRLALSHPATGFFLEHEGKSLFASAACPDDPRERMAQALGDGALLALLPVEERRLGIAVSGHVAAHDYSLPSGRGLFAFVNGRYVRDRGIHFAVQRAFQDLLPHGRQPAVVLFIEVDPGAVDVNVHPQKLEVRFSDPRGVYDAVHAAVARAVCESALEGRSALPGSPLAPSPHYAFAVEQFLKRAQEASWGGPLPLARVEEGATPGLGHGAGGAGTGRPGINQAPPPHYFSSLQYRAVLARRFWICEAAGGTLVVVDPHAAIERARLTSLRRAFNRDPCPDQAALFSATVSLRADEVARLMASQRGLAALGFEIEHFGGDTVALKAMPAELAGADRERLLRALALVLPPPEAELTLDHFDRALRLLACHAAADPERSFAREEREALFAALESADFEPACLHPEIILSELPLLELEHRARGRSDP